eukprot:PhM_4_TR268/c0_g1_i1/m.1601
MSSPVAGTTIIAETPFVTVGQNGVRYATAELETTTTIRTWESIRSDEIIRSLLYTHINGRLVIDVLDVRAIDSDKNDAAPIRSGRVKCTVRVHACFVTFPTNSPSQVISGVVTSPEILGRGTCRIAVARGVSAVVSYPPTREADAAMGKLLVAYHHIDGAGVFHVVFPEVVSKQGGGGGSDTLHPPLHCGGCGTFLFDEHCNDVGTKTTCGATGKRHSRKYPERKDTKWKRTALNGGVGEDLFRVDCVTIVKVGGKVVETETIADRPEAAAKSRMSRESKDKQEHPNTVTSSNNNNNDNNNGNAIVDDSDDDLPLANIIGLAGVGTVAAPTVHRAMVDDDDKASLSSISDA